MSLKIENSPKTIIKWVAISVFLIVLIIFFVRIAVWEDAYYREKEGSEREQAIVNIEESTEEELVEIAPTSDEIREYVVGAQRPRYLSIAKLNIKNARILPMGINAKGELKTPNNIFDVGWYEASYAPGEGGTMVIDGHNGGPHVHGVFKDLPDLQVGDIIKIERGDGKIFNYSVVENKSVLLIDADAYMSVAMRSPEKGKESVTLISCTGEWSQVQGTYLSRQFTRAVLVSTE